MDGDTGLHGLDEVVDGPKNHYYLDVSATVRLSRVNLCFKQHHVEIRDFS